MVEICFHPICVRVCLSVCDVITSPADCVLSPVATPAARVDSAIVIATTIGKEKHLVIIFLIK